MVEKREAYAPWSLTRKAGVQSATVNSDIDVPQNIQPVLNTGFVDEKGDWIGQKSSDEQFIAFNTDEAIPNTGEILTPQLITIGQWPIDMTGYKGIFIAINPSNGGNYKIEAIMGPENFSNLGDVNAGTVLKGNVDDVDSVGGIYNLFVDDAESLTADVWNIFLVSSRLQAQKLLQFKITNNSGGESNIQTAFMRIV